ncbi:MAG TPA: hypothetical protein VG737_07540 [Cyclobacteriaceae bacterium]|nr:hypothetical protein [Cyclobacteriaceae bacterium]
MISSKGKRKWMTYRRIHTVMPMVYLSPDIKYLGQGEGRSYYLLSIMDVFSRRILIICFSPAFGRQM